MHSGHAYASPTRRAVRLVGSRVMEKRKSCGLKPLKPVCLHLLISSKEAFNELKHISTYLENRKRALDLFKYFRPSFGYYFISFATIQLEFQKSVYFKFQPPDSTDEDRALPQRQYRPHRPVHIF